MAKDKPPRVRGAIGRRLFRIPFMRRFYARRIVSFIDKSKRKKRPLPENLQAMDSQLGRLPKAERLKAIEMSLRPGAQEELGRDIRRAAARQERLSGRGGGKRPGAPPTQGKPKEIRRK
ncbi:MAG: hypothetical protein ACRD1G_02270 [Acidimicrobiales bacterium]